MTNEKLKCFITVGIICFDDPNLYYEKFVGRKIEVKKNGQKLRLENLPTKNNILYMTIKLFNSLYTVNNVPFGHDKKVGVGRKNIIKKDDHINYKHDLTFHGSIE